MAQPINGLCPSHIFNKVFNGDSNIAKFFLSALQVSSDKACVWSSSTSVVE
jgi:hypothetical protein